MGEKQKITNDAYRKGYERIFGKKDPGHEDTRTVKRAIERDAQWYIDNPTYSDADEVRENMGATHPHTGEKLVQSRHRQKPNNKAYREGHDHVFGGTK